MANNDSDALTTGVLLLAGGAAGYVVGSRVVARWLDKNEALPTAPPAPAPSLATFATGSPGSLPTPMPATSSQPAPSSPPTPHAPTSTARPPASPPSAASAPTGAPQQRGPAPSPAARPPAASTQQQAP